jgi:stage II sporulation protein D
VIRWARAIGALTRYAVLVSAILTISTCAPTGAPTIRPAKMPVVRVQIGGVIARVPIEEYVRVVVLSELAPADGDASASARMLELQAIISRTYAVAPRHRTSGFDVCATTHCQLYQPERVASASWAHAAAAAVRRTTGVLVWFGDVPAQIVFHADCGGQTSSARDVWSSADPAYLVSVTDSGAASGAHRGWRFTPAGPALIAALNADPRTRVGSRLTRIDVLRRDRAGRAQLIALDGERAPVIASEELRLVLNRAFGPRALRSTRFTVRRTDTGFEFTGSGFGHGVGLCQAGALARIKAGASVTEVLAHYFPGTGVH